jgi:hypothetical protein
MFQAAEKLVMIIREIKATREEEGAFKVEGVEEDVEGLGAVVMVVEVEEAEVRPKRMHLRFRFYFSI